MNCSMMYDRHNIRLDRSFSMSGSMYDRFSLSESSMDTEYEPPKKGVTFASHAKVKVLKINQDIDPKSTWYSSADYKRFRYDRVTDALAMKGRHPDDLEEDECFWGMENILVSDLRDRASQTKVNVIQGVLIEQRSQERLCRHSPNDIARKSTDYSQWSAAVASKKALFYSSEVAKELQEAGSCSGT